jgi:hypothetical protein
MMHGMDEGARLERRVYVKVTESKHELAGWAGGGCLGLFYIYVLSLKRSSQEELSPAVGVFCEQFSQ